MKFKVGDKVRIRSNSEFYYQQFKNYKISSKNDKGSAKILEIREGSHFSREGSHFSYWVWIIFQDGYSNCYREEDLELVSPKEVKKFGITDFWDKLERKRINV